MTSALATPARTRRARALPGDAQTNDHDREDPCDLETGLMFDLRECSLALSRGVVSAPSLAGCRASAGSARTAVPSWSLMPDSRTARGPHPKDSDCFAPSALPALRLRGGRALRVAARSRLFQEGRAQAGRRSPRTARSPAHGGATLRRERSGPDRALKPHPFPSRALAGETLAVDGYNVLLTVEAALSGASSCSAVTASCAISPR